MSDPGSEPRADAGRALFDLYDATLPQVYGYLLRRCARREIAEELTSETFLAAAEAARRDPGTPIGVGWLIGTARHKLADHWRRADREQRHLRTVAAAEVSVDDPWDVRLDVVQAERTLRRMTPQHRLALTLRYLDDLPVPEVADILGRTVHATEALLVRARRAFRNQYEGNAEP